MNFSKLTDINQILSNDFAGIHYHLNKISTQIIRCKIFAPCDFLQQTLDKTIYSIHYLLYTLSTLYTIYSIHYLLYTLSTLYTIYSIHYLHLDLHYTLSTLYTIYSLHYLLYTVSTLYTIYSVHHILDETMISASIAPPKLLEYEYKSSTHFPRCLGRI